MDIICAHCAEPWDVLGLREVGYSYVTPLTLLPTSLHSFYDDVMEDIDDWIGNTQYGDKMPYSLAESVREFNNAIYLLVGHGRGCPSCGFRHGPGVGLFRMEQLEEMLMDGPDDADQFLA